MGNNKEQGKYSIREMPVPSPSSFTNKFSGRNVVLLYKLHDNKFNSVEVTLRSSILE